MARLLALATELDPNVVLPASLTALGVIVTALFAYLASRARKNPPPDEPEPKAAPSPLASFSGTQNEFMALVIADNAAIRSDVATLQAKVRSLESDLATARDQHSTFERAVRRYLELLAREWPGPSPMPWPDAGDLGTLERVLPRWGRRHPATGPHSAVPPA